MAALNNEGLNKPKWLMSKRAQHSIFFFIILTVSTTSYFYHLQLLEITSR